MTSFAVTEAFYVFIQKSAKGCLVFKNCFREEASKIFSRAYEVREGIFLALGSRSCPWLQRRDRDCRGRSGRCGASTAAPGTGQG